MSSVKQDGIHTHNITCEICTLTLGNLRFSCTTCNDFKHVRHVHVIMMMS